MSLDFVILGGSGTPTVQIPLSGDLHYVLITTAHELGLKHFSRFEDYYEDAEIGVEEMDAFLEQLKTFCEAAPKGGQLDQFLGAFEQLIIEARMQGRPVLAIAD